MNIIKLGSEQLTPSKIVCVGRNYTAHIAELNNETPEQIVLFNKPNSAITSTLNTSHNGDVLHYETELCFIVKNKQFVGVGLGLDLTKRTVQSRLKSKGLPWERAKAFDGSALFSEFVEISQSMQQFSFELKIDGNVIQHGDTEYMLQTPSALLAEITGFMSLEDGDIVMTGTPSGVGEVKPNSVFSVALFANNTCLVDHQWSVNKVS